MKIIDLLQGLMKISSFKDQATYGVRFSLDSRVLINMDKGHAEALDIGEIGFALSEKGEWTVVLMPIFSGVIDKDSTKKDESTHESDVSILSDINRKWKERCDVLQDENKAHRCKIEELAIQIKKLKHFCERIQASLIEKSCMHYDLVDAKDKLTQENQKLKDEISSLKSSLEGSENVFSIMSSMYKDLWNERAKFIIENPDKWVKYEKEK